MTSTIKKYITHLRYSLALSFLSLGVAAGSAILAHSWKISVERMYRTQEDARVQQQTKLHRAKEEEQEIKQGLTLYNQLLARGVIGEENRLDLVETFSKIKINQKLFDLRYEIEPQQNLENLNRTSDQIEFRASRVKLHLALLHEGQLFRFFSDLEKRGKGFYQLKSCSVKRDARSATLLESQLSADCELDWITIRGKK